MDYNAPQLIFLLVFFFFIYFLIPKRFQWISLLAANLVFYFIVGYLTVFYLLFSTVCVFYAAKWIEQLENSYRLSIENYSVFITEADRSRLRIKVLNQKRGILILTLTVNFLILILTKYIDTFLNEIYTGFNLIPKGYMFKSMEVLVPVGIAFYTLQVMGYLIDIYRGRYPASNNLAKFTLFTSFFPQLLQGPINRYEQLSPQIEAPHAFDYTNFKFGLQLILWGLFKKLVIADRAYILVAFVMNKPSNFKGLAMAITGVVFLIQVYANFSGVVDISRGIAQCCGINLPDNFKRPYFAKSITEYWNRWNITLVGWMKDYVYTPLTASERFLKFEIKLERLVGPSLGERLAKGTAALLLFALIGLWQGAGIKYLVYGIYNGLIIFTSVLLFSARNRPNEMPGIKRPPVLGFIKIIGTLILVYIGRFFIMAKTPAGAIAMMKSIITGFNIHVLTNGSLFKMGLNKVNVFVLIISAVLMLIVSIFQERGLKIRETISRWNIIFRWGIYLLMIYGILLFGIYGVGYKTVDFLYKGF